MHFPLALLVTALFFDLLAIFSRGRRWLDHGATLLYCLATLGATAAWLSGLKAADSMWSMPGPAQAALSEHQDLGLQTMAAMLVLLAFRLFVAWLARKTLHAETANLPSVTGARSEVILGGIYLV